MRLVSFSVKNYRSIQKTNRIEVGRSTVLVGPNNEGKSNILRALITAMEVLTSSVGIYGHGAVRTQIRTLGLRRAYQWEEDFPIALQESEPNGTSTLSLEFSLEPDEVNDFRREVKSNLNGSLPISLELGRERLKFAVHKKGPGGKSLSLKANEIARFVARRIEFEYIQAVRTAESAERVVNSLVQKQLRAVENQPEYQAALATIKKLQEPVLVKLSKDVQNTIATFLPAIRSVKFEITEQQRFQALRSSARTIIDDGTPTDLEHKGDGMQSLAALALMRHASAAGAAGKSYVIAIEEPESHLHPKAMHALRKVIDELAEKHQVVITTHSPLFVDRMSIQSNVIVDNHKAVPAKSIEEIRSVLGVRASDNLRLAELVVVVEGDEDKTALRALLRTCSPELADTIDSGKLAFETLGGGTNLPYVLGLLRDAMLCSYHSFLDNDSCGRESFAKAQAEGLAGTGDVNLAAVPGMKDSEIEDLYELSLYRDRILSEFAVDLSGNAKFRSNKKKWSDRVADVFKAAGKPWGPVLEMEVKAKVAALAAGSPEKALNANKRGSIDGLAQALLQKLRRSPGA